jgi:hypothetical protein
MVVHITNGESTAGMLRRWAGEPRLIVWNDILHEGPVRAGLALEQLSAERAAWMESEGFAELRGVGEQFADRDRQMRRLVARDSIWLWFEDDLYDQLQLLQILDFLMREQLTQDQIFFIDIPRRLEIDDMAGLAAAKRPVPKLAYELAALAWQAFTSPSAESWRALAGENTSALPHLRPAVDRLIEHYPDGPLGLNRVERTIVSLLRDKADAAEPLFVKYQQTEQRPFLGDSVFYWYIRRLDPMVAQRPDGIFELHPAKVPVRGPRWVGGVQFP